MGSEKEHDASAGVMGGFEQWAAEYAAASLRDADFETMSGIPLEPVYGPSDGREGTEWPGVYPFTRGPYASMYRSKLWTMRMFAGFGTAEDTNARFRDLLRAGGDGLSVAFDLPTLMGRDSDDPLSEGEVGRCGVAVDTLADMEDLFCGIDMAQTTTSMTINSPAPMVLAAYVVAAEEAGAERALLGGTLQNDMMKEYQAQKEYIFPPRPSLRLVTDVIRFCAAEMPRFHPVSVSGYHIREAGSTAAQELAFTLANGFAYVEAARASGLGVDEFAPRLSFFFNAHLDFFEEIAKYRAARRLWATWMRDRYGATDPRSRRLRFHTQTAGVSLTAQQPELNIVRTAVEALAGVLGGTQSLHTNSMDEVLALPTDKAARIALRTQQVIAHETGVANVADPLGGSWFVESLTDEMSRRPRLFSPTSTSSGLARCSRASSPASSPTGSRWRSLTPRTDSNEGSRPGDRSSSGSTTSPEGTRTVSCPPSTSAQRSRRPSASDWPRSNVTARPRRSKRPSPAWPRMRPIRPATSCRPSSRPPAPMPPSVRWSTRWPMSLAAGGSERLPDRARAPAGWPAARRFHPHAVVARRAILTAWIASSSIPTDR